MKKWARNFTQCRRCETKNKRHKGLGLCIDCYDRHRLQNPKRKLQVEAIKKRYYEKEKIKDGYLENKYIVHRKYRQGKTYQKRYLPLFYLRQKFQHAILGKRKLKGMIIVIDEKQVQTPIQDSNMLQRDIKEFTKIYRNLTKTRI